MTQAYVGSPLAQKLELKRGVRAWFGGLPDSVRAELDLAAIGVDEHEAASAGLDYVHLFCRDRATLARQLGAVRELIDPAAIVWVSWPTGEPTDLAEGIVRDLAATLGLADVRSCAINEDWSGLKLMIRRSLG